MTDPAPSRTNILFSDYSLYREKQKNGNGAASNLWPPAIVWARARGWLNVRDPADGTWFSIPSDQAPSGWKRIASEAKQAERG